MVNDDGENSYPNRGNETWMTDGYGDYVRHYLRAMQAFPELAPANQNHLLKTTSVIKSISYGKEKINYEVFDSSSVEILRLASKPKEIIINNEVLPESGKPEDKSSWSWKQLDKGGVLKIVHLGGNKIEIKF
jgi:hypothetical protein